MITHLDTQSIFENGNAWVNHHLTVRFPENVEAEIRRRSQPLEPFRNKCFHGEDPVAQVDGATAMAIADELGDAVLKALAAAAIKVDGRIQLSEARS